MFYFIFSVHMEPYLDGLNAVRQHLCSVLWIQVTGQATKEDLHLSEQYPVRSHDLIEGA